MQPKVRKGACTGKRQAYWTKNFSFDGNGTIVPNLKGKDSARENIHNDFHILGDASTNIKFRGNRDKTEWSLVSDLARLSFGTTNGFTKQPGTSSSLEASGEYSPKGLALRKSTIVFPGVTLNTKGSLTNTRGVFGPLTVNAEAQNLGTTFSRNATVKNLEFLAAQPGLLWSFVALRHQSLNQVAFISTTSTANPKKPHGA